LNQITPILRRVIGQKIPPNDLEDTLQEILISIHKARHTYDGQRPLMPWLMAITQFRISDALRKAYSGFNRKTVTINDLEEILENVTETPTSDESIDDILQGVPHREQTILTMMHVQGYTAKETSHHLGMKESAVKVAAHRAIKKLREKIGL
jgi:RNA polymerase sigma-70 factor (ECF subfamily)